MEKAADAVEKMLAYATGEIDEQLLARIEYLIEENRILRNQISKRILLTDAERTILERAAHTCPVHQSLGERVAAPIEFRYR